MFVNRDTHKEHAQRAARQHSGLTFSVTFDNDQIGLIPLAVMPPAPVAVVTPAEGGDDASDDERDGED